MSRREALGRAIRSRTGLFFTLMALSSGLALVRGFVLALLLAPAAFGTYALLVALGTFGASVLGFGSIERTYKRFPRMFVDGHAWQALEEADRIAWLLAGRALAVCGVATVGLIVAGRADWVVGALGAVGVAFATALQSSYISVQRASGELAPLARSALSRTVLALLLASAGALAASWPGAMAGEIVAALAGSWIARAYVARMVRTAGPVPTRPPEPVPRELWLFFAFLVSAVPLYLDRSLVSLMFGNAATGTYALLMLFVTSAFTLCSIVSQKLGPQLVRMERSGAPLAVQMRLLSSWVAGVGVVNFMGVSTASLVLLEGPLSPLATKYGLTPALLVATTMLCVVQVTHLVEWALIAHDRERAVFAAAILYLTAISIGALVVLAAGWGLASLLWALALAKLFHLVTLAALTALLSHDRAGRHAGPARSLDPGWPRT